MKKSIKLVLLIVFLLPFKFNYSQCTNTSNYPTADQIAPKFVDDTLIVSIYSYPGEYFLIKELEQSKTYRFISSEAGDYFTIRDAYNFSVLISHGGAPKSYVPNGIDIVSVHINLSSPACGTNTVNRTISVVCTDCPSTTPGVGVATTTPSATFEVNGEIMIGDVKRPPLAGMIRWNSSLSDFEGFNGTQWISLTKSRVSEQWGVSSSNATEDNKIVSSDGLTFDRFGKAVSVSGDYAVVGAFSDDVNSNSDQGSAYVFKRSGSSWVEHIKLTANDGFTGDEFGTSVDIDGDYIVVGAPYDDPNDLGNAHGSAYVFHRSGATWTQQAKLVSLDIQSVDFFGQSVTISGDYIVVGAPKVDNFDSLYLDQGAVYIFKRSGSSWTQKTKIFAIDGKDQDKFGSSVALNNDFLIVGAPEDDIGTNVDQGSAYIYRGSDTTWTQQAKINQPSGLSHNYFGYDVDIDGNYAVVGAPRDDINNNSTLEYDQGSAIIYIRNGTNWNFQRKIIANDGIGSSLFGESVSINGDFLLVGAVFANVLNNSSQGSAYIYIRDTEDWFQRVKLVASDGSAQDGFGIDVSIDNNTMIIGSPYDDIGTEIQQGSAYIFTKK